MTRIHKAKPDLELYQALDRIHMSPHERALAKAHMAQAEFLVAMILDAGTVISRVMEWTVLVPLKRAIALTSRPG